MKIAEGTFSKTKFVSKFLNVRKNLSSIFFVFATKLFFFVQNEMKGKEGKDNHRSQPSSPNFEPPKRLTICWLVTFLLFFPRKLETRN